jgi:hypothetical protein
MRESDHVSQPEAPERAKKLCLKVQRQNAATPLRVRAAACYFLNVLDCMCPEPSKPETQNQFPVFQP